VERMEELFEIKKPGSIPISATHWMICATTLHAQFYSFWERVHKMMIEVKQITKMLRKVEDQAKLISSYEMRSSDIEKFGRKLLEDAKELFQSKIVEQEDAGDIITVIMLYWIMTVTLYEDMGKAAKQAPVEIEGVVRGLHDNIISSKTHFQTKLAEFFALRIKGFKEEDWMTDTLFLPCAKLAKAKVAYAWTTAIRLEISREQKKDPAIEDRIRELRLSLAPTGVLETPAPMKAHTNPPITPAFLHTQKEQKEDLFDQAEREHHNTQDREEVWEDEYSSEEEKDENPVNTLIEALKQLGGRSRRKRSTERRKTLLSDQVFATGENESARETGRTKRAKGLVGVFEGTEGPMKAGVWLSSLIVTMENYSRVEMMDVLLANMRGDAKAWLLTNIGKSNWDEFARKFMRKYCFGATVGEVGEAFLSAQHNATTVDDIANWINGFTIQYKIVEGKLTESQKIGRFLNILMEINVELATKAKEHGAASLGWEEMLTLVRRLEKTTKEVQKATRAVSQFHNQQDHSYTRNRNSGYRGRSHGRRSGARGRNYGYRRGDRKEDFSWVPPHITCNFCKGKGHIARQCNASRDIWHVICSNCGGNGHRAGTCATPTKERKLRRVERELEESEGSEESDYSSEENKEAESLNYERCMGHFVNRINVKPKDRTQLVIEANVDGLEIEMLVDTGSELSLINQGLVRKIRNKRCISRTWKGIAKGANNKRISMGGIFEIEMEVGNVQKKIQVVVADISDNIILGMDFMEDFVDSIEVKNRILHLANGTSIALNEKCHNLKQAKEARLRRIRMENSIKLVVKEKTIIPPHTTKLVGAKVKTNKVCKANNVMIESKLRFNNRPGISVMAMISPVEKKGNDYFSRIAVSNFTEREVAIEKNTSCKAEWYSGGKTIWLNGELSAKRKESNNKVSSKKLKAAIKQKAWESKFLEDNQKTGLTGILTEMASVFEPKFKPGKALRSPHRINVMGHPPIKTPLRRKSERENDIISRQVQEMKKQGVIQDSKSPWSFAVILAPKKDGTYRFCVDYRPLNKITKKDVYPLPKIDEVFDQLGGAAYFSALDLTSGYWQIPMHPDDKEKTAFRTRDGLFEWNVMPFGLSNAPGSFQRDMEYVLSSVLWKCALVYIDDIIIYSESWEQHLSDLKEVLMALDAVNMFCKLRKCNFGMKELPFLGHVISKEGVKPDPKKIEAVMGIEAPTDTTGIKMFLGLTGYYRRFIKNYAQIAAPLNTLLRKNTKWKWKEEQQKAFENLKRKLVEAPILTFPDWDKPFSLHVDTSSMAMGGVLTQMQKGKEKVIAYGSKTFVHGERHYNTTEQECLAIVHFTNYWRQYLFGKKIKVVSDHKPLRWLGGVRNTRARYTRWWEYLQDYELEVVHRKGRLHTNADALSRLKIKQEETKDIAGLDRPENPFITPLRARQIVIDDTKVEFETLFKEQRKDPIVKTWIDFLEKGILPGNEKEAKKIRTRTERMTLEEGILFIRMTGFRRDNWRKEAHKLVVIPKSMVEDIIKAYHNSRLGGHRGIETTIGRIMVNFWWPTLNADVKRWCKGCETCREIKPYRKQKSGKLHSIPIGYPWERVGVDMIADLPTTKRGNKYIIVFVDYFTKWVEAFPVPDQSAATTAWKFVTDIICRHGAPKFLMSDRGPNFLSEMVEAVNKDLGILKQSTVSYRPQCDGQAENAIGTIKTILKAWINEEKNNWDVNLPFALAAMRFSPHSTTKEMPFFLEHGRGPTLPVELLYTDKKLDRYTVNNWRSNIVNKMREVIKAVRKRIANEQKRHKKYYDKKRREAPEYVPGDRVMKRNRTVNPISNKFEAIYKGPYRVVETFGKGNIIIVHENNPEDMVRTNIDEIQPFELSKSTIKQKKDQAPQVDSSADKGSGVGSQGGVENGSGSNSFGSGVDLKKGSGPGVTNNKPSSDWLGRRVAVWYEDRKLFYRGVITGATGKWEYTVHFDNDEVDTVRLNPKFHSVSPDVEDRWLFEDELMLLSKGEREKTVHEGKKAWRQIEKIIEERKRGETVQFLVRWKGHTRRHDEWMDERDIVDRRVIEQFRTDRRRDDHEALPAYEDVGDEEYEEAKVLALYFKESVQDVLAWQRKNNNSRTN